MLSFKTALTMKFFLGSDRAYHSLETCSITNLPKLQQWLSLLPTAVEKHGWESDEVDSVLEQVYKLAGVEDSWVDRYNQEEVLQSIAEVNFQEVRGTGRIKKSLQKAEEKDEGKSMSLEDYCYLTVTSLVNAELAVDLESAIAIASSVPLADLEGYLRYRIKFLNHAVEEEEKKNREREKASQELVEELQDGSFFGDGFLEALAGGKSPDYIGNREV